MLGRLFDSVVKAGSGGKEERGTRPAGIRVKRACGQALRCVRRQEHLDVAAGYDLFAGSRAGRQTHRQAVVKWIDDDAESRPARRARLLSQRPNERRRSLRNSEHSYSRLGFIVEPNTDAVGDGQESSSSFAVACPREERTCGRNGQRCYFTRLYSDAGRRVSTPCL